MHDIDPRVTCAMCKHYRRGWCQNARQAQLSETRTSVEVGPELAKLAQWCNGYRAA